MADTAPSPAADRLPSNGPRRPLPWMSMPGAPPRPNGGEFASKMSQLNAQKRKHIDEVRALQSSIQAGDNRSELDTERNELRQRLNEIDTLRRSQAQLRTSKTNEIAKIRQQRRECTDKLRELQNDLGGMKDVREIDAAIDHLMKKMETSGGSLTAERRTVKQLHQLEEAKNLFLELQPLTERIQEAEEREILLQQEYREIHERISVLSKEFDDQLGVKRTKDLEARSTTSSRAEIYKQCDNIRVHIHAIDEEMNALRTAHNKATEAWDTWCLEARAKYQAKIEAEREARHRAFLERKNAVKNAVKLERARHRQNPYELEISACDTLVQYLIDKKRLTAAEQEERKKREAAVNFDASKVAPPGSVVLNDSQWTNATPLSKAARKQQQQQKKKREEAAATKAVSVASPAPEKKAESQRTHVMQHPEDKMRLFQLVEQSPPLSLAAIGEAVASIGAKKKEYEGHIVTGDPKLSSSDSEADEAEEKDDEDVAQTKDSAAEAKAEEPAATTKERKEGEKEETAAAE